MISNSISGCLGGRGLGGNIGSVRHIAFLQSVCGWVTRHNGALYGAIFSGFLNQNGKTTIPRLVLGRATVEDVSEVTINLWICFFVRKANCASQQDGKDVDQNRDQHLH